MIVVSDSQWLIYSSSLETRSNLTTTNHSVSEMKLEVRINFGRGLPTYLSTRSIRGTLTTCTICTVIKLKTAVNYINQGLSELKTGLLVITFVQRSWTTENK